MLDLLKNLKLWHEMSNLATDALSLGIFDLKYLLFKFNYLIFNSASIVITEIFNMIFSLNILRDIKFIIYFFVLSEEYVQ